MPDQTAGEPETMAMWVLFTPEGLPGWFGPEPIAGAEWVEDLPSNAAALMRVDGKWVPRPPPPEPTEAELAALRAQIARDQAAAEAEAAAEAQRAREEEIVRRSGPDQLLRSMGKITIAELTARVAAIRAEVEAGH